MSDAISQEALETRTELEKDKIETPAETATAAAGLEKAMRNAYYMAAALTAHGKPLTASARRRCQAAADAIAAIAPEAADDIAVTADPEATAESFEACGNTIAGILQHAAAARKRLAKHGLKAETTKQDLMKNLQNIEMKSKGDKTLKMLVDWKEFEAKTGFGKMARLGELTVDNVKTLLTCLRGGKESKE